MNLSEKEREAAFPVRIDLGRKEGDAGMPVAVSENVARGTKRKPRTFYPTLYVDAVPGLEQLPKEGCILVKFRRKRLSVEENMDGEETTGATLEIQALCLPEDMGKEGETLEDAFKKLGRGEVAADNDQYAGDDDE